ncbi:MAG: tRNA(Ile)(2)-agmatinylcytidine synthase [Candidatus Bathyarchaeota archaeon]|nr:tRNA(Ile)(2)-agmatinylcytidine synthase [Candidatus Bathyarchaeota archaeon]
MTIKTLHIGLDDTDSTRKGCTTYVAALLVERLLQQKAKFADYPNLVRLNPNVPWKTRGNGAVCLRISYDEEAEERIKETIINTVEEQADFEAKGTDPGIAFLQKRNIPREIKAFAQSAITGIVTLKDALKLSKKFHAEVIGYKKCRGIIGALAAIGEPLVRDHTYEIIAYRTPENLGIGRMVDEASIFEMDEATAPYTFNNVDWEKKRVIITPRGPDPILLGIRGESPEIVRRAFDMVKLLEPAERWVIFRTNQGTDAHLRVTRDLKDVKPFSPIVTEGSVAADPKIIPRRHVIFPITDDETQVDCAAYEPTGSLRKAAAKLLAGDRIKIYGSVRPAAKTRRLTVNLEKFRLLKPASVSVYRNPLCPKCHKRVKSMGKDQGFRCEKCCLKYPNLQKVEVKLKRDLGRGLYVASPRSQRHLTKPLRRYGLEKRRAAVGNLVADWHFP